MQQHESEDSKYQKVLADTTQMYEKKIAELNKLLGDERSHFASAEEQLDLMKKLLSDSQKSIEVRNLCLSSTFFCSISIFWS
jgi:kinesin family protein 5